MATYTLISSNVLTSSAASVTFSSIPATYTDLVLRVSARDTSDSAISEIIMRINGETGYPTIYSNTYLLGDGSSASSGRASNSYTRYIINEPGTGYTSSTFNSLEIYIPSYNASQNKPMSIISATETNASGAYMVANAMLRSNTAAITEIALSSYTTFVSGSSFYLYGISNA
jgi:hypothetical protein